MGKALSFAVIKTKVFSAILLAGLMVLLAPSLRAEDLHYFKNYFVTGDYAVAGVGLWGQGKNGLATGKITMAGVPANADIVAAFLYWETVETTPNASSMNGFFDNQAIVGAVLGNPQTQPCWSSGGTAGQGLALRVYRADVLRYLAIDSVNNIRIANGAHTVMLPIAVAGGNGQPPHTEGASLVVIYRLTKTGEAPLKAVVIFDGAATMTKSSAPFLQKIEGFYQAAGSAADLSAYPVHTPDTMTQIVGNGQPGFPATLTVTSNTSASTVGVSGTPFIGAQGTRWDNYRFNVNLNANDSYLTTQVTTGSNQVCLSWGAVITGTNVVNSDLDGILNIWKTNGLHLNVGSPATSTTPSTAATFGGCADYPNDPCENLPAMGAVLGTAAKPNKDIFVQIDWMQGNDGHIHVPKLSALQSIASVFSTHNITVHFDVGSHYQSPALPFIVPAAVAQGGQVIYENPMLECPNTVITDSTNCPYNNPVLPYSVLGWKSGMNAIKNGFQVLSIPPHFMHDRKDIFHYILFGHALAGPTDPATGKPVDPPASVSGVGDLWGGDLMVTLGLWRTDNPANCVQDDPTGVNQNICTDQTGTSLIQAGTMMHELGHNLGLSHAGSYRAPNCMPNYPSIMNYLYQTRGLTDALGNEHIDYSYGTLFGLNENSLSETASMGPLAYRVRYFAPPNSLEAASVAKAQCDGSRVTGAPGVRLETPGLVTPDWNNDGKVDADPSPLDINFNGTPGSVTADSIEPSDVNASDPNKLWFVDHDDWDNLNLQQVGARVNIAQLSADVGPIDLGPSDISGQTEFGQTEFGQTEFGQTEFGQTEFGQTEFGQTEFGQTEFGEPDYKTAISTLDATAANTPLVGAPSASTGTAYNQISLSWGLPGLGQIRTYTIYRTNLSVMSAAQVTVVAGSVSSGSDAPPATTFSDRVTDTNLSDIGANCPSTSVCYDTNYQYYVVATDKNNNSSTPSNFVTVTVDHLFVTAYTGSVIYGNTLPNSTSATISGLPSGGITSANFTCPTPAPRNVGSYADICTGPVTVGTGSVYGVTYIQGTLMITPRPLTITAQPNTKVFDNTTSAAAKPVVVGLAYNDTVNPLAETYDNPKAGTGKTLTVTTYTINDGNGGKNYTVTTVVNTNGVITHN